MFEKRMSKTEIIQFLEYIRRTELCGYVQQNYCDCKYGVDYKKEPNILNHRCVGEKNGCPEMRTIIEILKRISYKQFK